ncbi:MAG: hypothetical protein AABY88_00420 [Pseudomonadota bacterium]
MNMLNVYEHGNVVSNSKVRHINWIVKATIASVVTGFSLTTLAAPTSRAWAPYSEVYGIFAKFLAIPAEERDTLSFRLRIKPPASITRTDQIDLRMGLVTGARRIEISPDWMMLLPIDPALAKSNLTIATNLIIGQSLILKPELVMKPQPGLNWNYAQLAHSLDQANKAVRAQAGVWAMFAPKSKEVLMTFDKATVTVRLQTTKGVRNIPVSANGEAKLLLDSALVRQQATIIMSAAPRETRPLFSSTIAVKVDSDT